MRKQHLPSYVTLNTDNNNDYYMFLQNSSAIDVWVKKGDGMIYSNMQEGIFLYWPSNPGAQAQ